MSIRSQKKNTVQQEVTEIVSSIIVSTVLVEDVDLGEQDIMLECACRPKSPRVERTELEKARASLKEEMTSELNGLLVESRKELLKVLKTRNGGNTTKNLEPS